MRGLTLERWRTLMISGSKMSAPGSVMELANFENTTGSLGTGRFYSRKGMVSPPEFCSASPKALRG